jgi:hypothetical protein
MNMPRRQASTYGAELDNNIESGKTRRRTCFLKGTK